MTPKQNAQFMKPQVLKFLGNKAKTNDPQKIN